MEGQNNATVRKGEDAAKEPKPDTPTTPEGEACL